MSTAHISPRVWPTVAVEATRFWLRRHRVVLGVLGALTFAYIVFGLGSQDQLVENLLPFVLAFVPFGAGLLTMSGIVGDERASGIILMWFQKPGSIMRAYAIRYAIYQCMLLTFTLLFAVTLIIVGELGVGSEVKAGRLPLIVTTFALLPSAIVFALSAWGVRRDSTAAVLVIMVSFVFATSFPIGSEARELLLLFAFPIDELQRITNATSMGELWRPISIIVAQFVAWTAIGFAGLGYTQRRLHRVA